MSTLVETDEEVEGGEDMELSKTPIPTTSTLSQCEHLIMFISIVVFIAYKVYLCIVLNLIHRRRIKNIQKETTKDSRRDEKWCSTTSCWGSSTGKRKNVVWEAQPRVEEKKTRTTSTVTWEDSWNQWTTPFIFSFKLVN